MPVNLTAIAGGAAALGAAAGIAYTSLAVARMRAFRKRAAEKALQPPVTVLKPLHGDEPHLYENLRSFCEQEYPQFQIIFGAADAADPALEHARRLQREFPGCDISIAAGNAGPALNPKVANLQGMLPHAKYGVLAIADSDIRVGSAYLQAVAAGFADERNGAVTCLYGGAPDNTLACALGAMHVNDQFSPSVLVALALEPLQYCFGATMAVRRDVLNAIGGLESLAGNLGDDYLLGKLVSDAGYRVHLLPYVVQTSVIDRSMRALWQRELRWARTIFSSRPAGYAGSIITYPLPLAALAVALSPSPATLGIFTAAAALRVLLHVQAQQTFAPHTRLTPLLIPLRDALGASIWAASFFGRRVEWRSADFTVEAGGHMAVRDH